MDELDRFFATLVIPVVEVTTFAVQRDQLELQLEKALEPLIGSQVVRREVSVKSGRNSLSDLQKFKYRIMRAK